MVRLEEAARLAGFAGAHAVWCVSSGETLVPLILWSNESGERNLERLVASTFEEGVAKQEERMEALATVAQYAVSAFDGFINENGLRTNTLFITARAFNETSNWIKFGVSYTPKKILRKFAVHPLRILSSTDVDNSQMEQITNAFFSGVAEHPKGSKLWRTRSVGATANLETRRSGMD